MTEPERPGVRQVPWLIALQVLLLLAAAVTWFPVLRSFANVEINYNEGWNAYRQTLAASGTPLYTSPPLYTVTNYPPLSFHIIGFLGKLTGNMLAAGRTVSLISFVGIAFLIAATVKQFTGRWFTASYAGLAYVIWMGLFQPDRIGMNDPQLLATVICMLGFWVYVRKPESMPWLAASAALFAVSLFTKHNLLDFPLVVGAHLLLQRAWRRLAVWSVVFALSASFLLILIRVDGPYFWAHMAAPRPYLMLQAWLTSATYLQDLQIPAAVALLWAFWNRRDPSRSLLCLALVFTNLTAFAFSGGYGVDGNIFFDAIIAAIIILGVAAHDIQMWAEARGFGVGIRTAILLVPLAGMLPMLPERILRDTSAASNLSENEFQFAQAVAFLAGRPGPAFCANQLICFEAGKPEVATAYFVSNQVGVGNLTEADVLTWLDTQQFPSIELEKSGDGLAVPGQWLEGFAKEIGMRYRIALRAGKYALTIPASE